MTSGPNAIANFWELFRARAAELALAKSADEPVYDALLEQLQKIDSGLYLEFCAQPGARELIITAEGEKALFPLVRSIVAAAPAVDGWRIRALKPRLGFAESGRWGGVTIRSAEIFFQAFEAQASGELYLHIFVPEITEDEEDDAHNAVLRLMDHGVGEEALAEAVRGTDVRLLRAGSSTKDFLPLVDLPDFLEWRSQTRGGARLMRRDSRRA